MSKVGIYPGSFDPVTLGHLDIIERSLSVVDNLIIGVSSNDNKSHMFDSEIRVKLIQDSIAQMNEEIKKRFQLKNLTIYLLIMLRLRIQKLL